MPLFQNVNGLQTAIQNALPGWTFQLNQAIAEPENSLQISANTFSLWRTPEGESIVVSIINTSLTGSERQKPQIRIFTEKAHAAYKYAKAHGLRYFFFVYCTDATGALKLPAGIDPSHYLVSIESKITSANVGRLDIRSMFDALENQKGQAFFRVTSDMHRCPSLAQGAFIHICDNAGAFTADILKSYIQCFDSRPYMPDAQNGTRAVYTPSALYEPDNSPLSLPWNLLVHGAPGTGKSHFIDQQVKEYQAGGASVETKRITFFEDYSYGQFVGQYMPAPEDDSRQQLELDVPGGTVSGTVSGEHITYRFVPGPFAELLAKSFAAKLNGDTTKYILIIEELNRANAASVFGDIFQLLDRKDGLSIYQITPQTELAQYLFDTVGALLKPGVASPSEDAFTNIRLPDNFYIWATMNGADQGVFPLDSAFKRRWSYIYRDIDEVDPASALRPRICLPCRDSETSPFEPRELDWNSFRHAINDIILGAGFAEDRCIGYWYFSEEELRAIKAYTTTAVENRNGTGTNSLSALPNPLVDKLFAYLLQDVFRNTPASFFQDGIGTLSKVRQHLKDLAEGGLEHVCRLPSAAYVPNPAEA